MSFKGFGRGREGKKHKEPWDCWFCVVSTVMPGERTGKWVTESTTRGPKRHRMRPDGSHACNKQWTSWNFATPTPTPSEKAGKVCECGGSGMKIDGGFTLECPKCATPPQQER